MQEAAEQVHGELPAAVKAAWAGRVSVRVTASATPSPMLASSRVKRATDPGVAPEEVRVLTSRRSGVPGMTGVVSEAELLAGFKSSVVVEIEAELEIWEMEGGSVADTSRAKMRVAKALTGRDPRARVQVEPAAVEGVQDQPGLDAAALKLVWAGTVSVRTLPAAATLPRLR